MARRKLAALYDRGNVNRRKVARRVLYWRPDEPSPSSDPQQPVTAPADQAGSNMTGDATREAADTADETPPSTGNVDRDRLCDTLPGSGEVLEEACLAQTSGEVLAEVNVDATIEDDPANIV